MGRYFKKYNEIKLFFKYKEAMGVIIGCLIGIVIPKAVISNS